VRRLNASVRQPFRSRRDLLTCPREGHPLLRGNSHPPDRAIIRDEWINQAIEAPIREKIQEDGRIRRWTVVPEMDNRYLRVILLADGETVHNAFFDRGYVP